MFWMEKIAIATTKIAKISELNKLVKDFIFKIIAKIIAIALMQFQI
jgi:inosine/xanthosine triphosphate pyrophosphatase family protein